MKRITSFILMVFVLIISVHPVIAFHFCSDRLVSTHFYNIEQADDCQSEQMSCCCCEHNSKPTPKISEGSCCEVITYEISTDDYQLIAEQTIPTPNFVFAALPIEGISIPTYSAEPVRHLGKAPPEEFYKTGREILSHICILII